MAHTIIRPARAEDRESVLAFCARIWEGGDYIEHVWDDWLLNPQGYLIVATLDDKPVGMAHLRMLNKTDAWLEGMRVDPDYRQLGLATALQQAMLEEAIQRGATNARLVTEAINSSAIRLVERNLMRRVAAFAPHSGLPVTAPSKRQYGLEKPTLATAADVNEIIDYLNVSNIFPAVGGLHYYGYTAYSITQQLLEEKVNGQHIYLLRRWERLDGLVIAEPRKREDTNQLFIGYIDGTTESISLLAYAMRRQAAEMGLNKVYALVPDLIMVRDAFAGAEYEWDGDVWYTYERGLV